MPIPVPGHPFNGVINGGLSPNVLVGGLPIAVVGSTASNQPPHIPIGGTSFQIPPTNQATITMGSTTVLVNGKGVARNGDPAATCDDMNPAPHGTIIAMGTVFAGG